MKQKKITWIMVLCYLAYTSIYIARLNLSTASPELQKTILDSAQIGLLGSVFSIVYACGRLFNGWLSDRVPPYVMIASGLLFVGLANITIGFFPPFPAIVLLWGINAYAQSMLWSSVLEIVSALYDPETAKRKASYMVTTVATGNVLGIIISTVLVSRFGVGYAFVVPGLITIFFAVLILLSTREIRPELKVKNHLSMWQILKQKDVRLLLIPTFCHGVIKDNISLWMVLYFVSRFNIDLKASAMFVLFVPLVGFAGRLMHPLCYRLCKENEHAASLVGFVLCTVALIPLLLDTVTPLIAAVCLSLVYAAVSVINTSMLSIFPLRYAETGNVASISGMLDFLTYGGAGVSSVLYGVLIDRMGQNGYAPMYLSWAVISLISMVFLCRLIKTDRRRNEYA